MADDRNYYQRAGDFPFQEGLFLEEVRLITGQSGIFGSYSNLPIDSFYNFPCYNHLFLSSYFTNPYPEGMIWQSYGEFPYYYSLKKSYIPVIKNPYPHGIMIEKRDETYPFYTHLVLVPFPPEEKERDLEEKNIIISDFINRFIDGRAGTINSFNSTTMIGVDYNE